MTAHDQPDRLGWVPATDGEQHEVTIPMLPPEERTQIEFQPSTDQRMGYLIAPDELHPVRESDDGPIVGYLWFPSGPADEAMIFAHVQVEEQP
jgi:hypothetical protein